MHPLHPTQDINGQVPASPENQRQILTIFPNTTNSKPFPPNLRKKVWSSADLVVRLTMRKCFFVKCNGFLVVPLGCQMLCYLCTNFGCQLLLQRNSIRLLNLNPLQHFGLHLPSLMEKPPQNPSFSVRDHE